MEMHLHLKKDLGLEEYVQDALPYAVVGGSWESSFLTATDLYTALVHIVPSGQQLKLLFLRIYTENAGGARFRIYQSNPLVAGMTGTVEAYPVVGSVPSGVRDRPFLEAAGGEVLRGSLEDPVHVFEGSIIFDVVGILAPLGGARYSITWWGLQKIPKR